MKLFVPDASVLLKWVLPTAENDLAAALALRDAATAGEVVLAVPSLWLYEVGNTLARRFPDHAAPMLEALVGYGLIERQVTRTIREQALALTRSHGVTFYDAAYHALALVEQGEFVTADRAYVKKAGTAGSVSLLGAARP